MRNDVHWKRLPQATTTLAAVTSKKKQKAGEAHYRHLHLLRTLVVKEVPGKRSPQASTTLAADTSTTSCVAFVASGSSSGAYPLMYSDLQSGACDIQARMDE